MRPKEHSIRTTTWTLAWLGLALLLPQTAHTGQKPASADASRERPSQERPLAMGDLLLVKVTDADGAVLHTEQCRVRVNGTIRMRLINEVPVAGRTVQQLESDLAKALSKKHFVAPRVFVDVLRYGNRVVFLMIGDGPVRPRPLGPKGTLSELLLSSGVSAPVLSSRQVTVTGADGVEREADLRKLFPKKGGLDPTSDWQLKAGDVIRCRFRKFLPPPFRKLLPHLVGLAG